MFCTASGDILGILSQSYLGSYLSWGPHSSAPARCFSPGFRWINKLAILTLQAVSIHDYMKINPLFWYQMLSPDGWTKNDLIYVWKQEGALQIANNLSLPGIILWVWHWLTKIFEFLGGFILSSTGNQGGAQMTAINIFFVAELQSTNWQYLCHRPHLSIVM